MVRLICGRPSESPLPLLKTFEEVANSYCTMLDADIDRRDDADRLREHEVQPCLKALCSLLREIMAEDDLGKALEPIIALLNEHATSKSPAPPPLGQRRDRAVSLTRMIQELEFQVRATPGHSDYVHVEPDGPVPPHWLRIKGKLHRIQPLHCRLLVYVWDRGQVEFEELASAVWEKEGTLDSTIRATISKLGNVLLDLNAPIRLSTGESYVIRERLNLIL